MASPACAVPGFCSCSCFFSCRCYISNLVSRALSYVCVRKVPLALMEEGLVDATVVAGVLSPKGKASPQSEPLFKIKAAAEAFRDMRKLIAETLEVRWNETRNVA